MKIEIEKKHKDLNDGDFLIVIKDNKYEFPVKFNKEDWEAQSKEELVKSVVVCINTGITLIRERTLIGRIENYFKFNIFLIKERLGLE